MKGLNAHVYVHGQYAFLLCSGQILPHFTVDTRLVSSPIDCVFECLGHAECKSLNFQDEGGAAHVCELNDAAAETPAHLVNKTGYSYYDALPNVSKYL